MKVLGPRLLPAMLGLATAAVLGVAERGAQAHVEVASGPAAAFTTQVVTFGVGHGCAGSDTYSVTIDIPAGVTGIRPLTSDFGMATVQKNMAGTIVSVTWQKPIADALDADANYYELRLRMKPPNAPFSTLYFPSHQICRTAAGVLLPAVDWVGTPTTVLDGGTAPEPAPGLKLVPARKAGWNSYIVPAAIADLATFFGDAAIVWKGSAAYSSNPSTATLIGATAGTTALTSLSAGDTVWVKY